MAKGNSPVNSFFGALLIAGILFLLLLMASVVIFPVVVVVTLIFLIAMHKAPSLPKKEISDPPEVSASCVPLMRERVRLLNDIGEVEDLARNAGVQRTQASAGRRFDGRTRIGRTANERLDVLEFELDLVQRQLESACASHWNENLKSYERKLKIWKFRMTIFRLFAFSSIFSILTMFLIKQFGLFGPDSIIYRFSRYISLDINPGISEYQAAAAVTTIVIWYVLMLSFYVPVRNRVPESSLGADYTTYLLLRRKWIELDLDVWAIPTAGASKKHGKFEGARHDSNERQDNKEEKLTKTESRSWREVLAVGEHPSVEEIKSAYRSAISQYHSDKVALLGEKIRKVAEDESKTINQAYEDAKREFGF